MPTPTILGSGIAGLTASIRLRLAGYSALVLEKNSSTGGKLACLTHDGFSFDLGPTVLTMPFVLRSLFASCGKDLEDSVELMCVEPTCRYHWSDGTRFDAFSEPERLEDQLANAFPEDAATVRALLNHNAILYDVTKDLFLFNRFEGIREFFKFRNMILLRHLPKFGVADTIDSFMRRRLSSPKLVQLFDRFATYNGSSPYRAPATFNVISHVELGMGLWYPRGGMAAIAGAVTTLAVELGVEIHTETPVDKLYRKGSRVTGLRAGGHSFATDAVISNIDVLTTYRSLLNRTGIATPRTVRRAERSSSGFLMLLAVCGSHPELAHHNVFFSDDYPEEFGDIFDRGKLPEAMTIYVSIASKSDPALAPAGCENWYVLVNAPAFGVEHHDHEAHELYAQSVLDRLAHFGLRPEILWQSRLTPVDFQTRYGGVDGALYGASSNSIFSAFLRPKNKIAELDNFYFAGGSTHPGGGVPLAVLSGTIVADMVVNDLRGQG